MLAAAVNIAVDYLVTTYINNEQYSGEQALVALGTGAVAGLIGGGLVGPAAKGAAFLTAEFVGGTAATRATTTLVTQAVVGGGLSGASNVLLTGASDTILNGLENGWDGSSQHFVDQLTSDQAVWDFLLGAAGYEANLLGGEWFAKNFLTPDTFWRVKHLLNTRYWDAGTGLTYAGIEAISDPGVIELIVDPILPDQDTGGNSGNTGGTGSGGYGGSGYSSYGGGGGGNFNPLAY